MVEIFHNRSFINRYRAVIFSRWGLYADFKCQIANSSAGNMTYVLVLLSTSRPGTYWPFLPDFLPRYWDGDYAALHPNAENLLPRKGWGWLALMKPNGVGMEGLRALIWAGPGPPAAVRAPATVKYASSRVNGAHLRDLFNASKLEDGDRSSR